MKTKLLILLTSSILFSGCYTHFRHVYKTDPVYDVYTYDDYYVYRYDPFWRYDASIAWYYDNYYFSLHFYPYRYYCWLPNYYNFKPHYHDWKNHHYRPKKRLMHKKPIIKHRQKDRHSVQVKPIKRRKSNIVGHKSGQNVRMGVQVKKKHVRQIPTFKKRVQKTRKNTHVRSTIKRHSSTHKANTKIKKSRKTRR